MAVVTRATITSIITIVSIHLTKAGVTIRPYMDKTIRTSLLLFSCEFPRYYGYDFDNFCATINKSEWQACYGGPSRYLNGTAEIAMIFIAFWRAAKINCYDFGDDGGNLNQGCVWLWSLRWSWEWVCLCMWLRIARWTVRCRSLWLACKSGSYLRFMVSLFSGP